MQIGETKNPVRYLATHSIVHYPRHSVCLSVCSLSFLLLFFFHVGVQLK